MKRSMVMSWIKSRVSKLAIIAMVALAAALGATGVASAAATTTVNGTGSVSYHGELTQFSLSITSDGQNTSGSCQFDGVRGTKIVCTSIYDFKVHNAHEISTRGTATLNGRPISFTVVVTDGGTGPQDTYTLYSAGRVIGGKLISGNVDIQSADSGPVAGVA